MIRTSFSNKNLDYVKKNYIFMALVALFIMGMIYGSLIVKTQSTQIFEYLSMFTDGYIGERQPFFQTMISSFLSTFLFVLLPYLLGYSAISQVVTIFIPLFKGLGLGLAMGYLYNTAGLSGVGYCFLIIIPQTIIAMFATFIGCRESVKLSNLFLSSIKKSDAISSEIIKLYNIKFFVLMIIAGISGFVHAICVLFFSNIFKI